MTYAKVIADSTTSNRERLTTFEVRFHRFVLAEFNTHRVFSRNSASSRAIPVAKQLERIKDDLAMPVSWPAEQKGMQGGAELSAFEAEGMQEDWHYLAEEATHMAGLMSEHGLHKSVVNRVLEPYMWHTVVVSGTAWLNFFRQRCSPLAQPEIRVAAELMFQAYRDSRPTLLTEGQWHLPYIDAADAIAVPDAEAIPTLVKVSAARCARVSYLTQDGKRDISEDLKLYERLVTAQPMHGSPLEHVATPNSDNSHEVVIPERDAYGYPIAGSVAKVLTLPRYGNLLGWHQHRFDVEAGLDYQAFA